MNDLTVVVPCYNGNAHLPRLLDSLPADVPVIVVDDCSEEPYQPTDRRGVFPFYLKQKGYFAGAVNAGIEACKTDVLVLNQDSWLEGDSWRELLAAHRGEYAFIGERIQGRHPAFPHGYIHGTFAFFRQDALDDVGLLNLRDFPLWGNTAEWQWRACRKGYKALPLPDIPGFHHERQGHYGDGIRKILSKEPEKRSLLIRTPPLVSVIIPCFNHGRYLEDAVNSLIGGPTSLGDMPGQTLQAFEVVIVDDASSDGSGDVAQAMANEWTGIRVVRHTRNRGAAAAQNTGVKFSVGDYVTVMDADDMREPDSLETLYRAALAHPHRVIYDDVTLFGGGKRGQAWPMSEYDFEQLLDKNQMHKGILFPRQAWREAGGYAESMDRGREDWAFNIALGRVGWCGVHVAQPGYLYRREGQNRTLHNTSPEWRDYFLRQLRDLYPDVYRGDMPMACCGKKDDPVRRALPNGDGATRSLTPSPSSLPQIEYVGGNVGEVTWGGPGATPSGKLYRFSGANRVRHVDARDVPWFVNLKDGGRFPFRAVQVAQPETQGTVTIDRTDGIDEDEARAAASILAQRKNEQSKFNNLQNLEPPQADVVVPDPADLTIAELSALSLSVAEWDELLRQERAGRARKGALERMEARRADAAA